MALRFFVKYAPPLRSRENIEYFQDFLSRIESTVTFQSSFYDNANTFGFLDGEGDEMSRILRLMEGRFSAVRLEPYEWAGAAYHAYVPYNGPEDPEVPGYMPPEDRQTWAQWMQTVGIPITDGYEIPCAKLYKAHLMKEIAKKKFYDNNDAIADISKIIMIFNVYRAEFTPEETAQFEQYIAAVRQIYTKEVALAGALDMISHLVETLQGYYVAKVALEAATTLEEINAINFE